MIFNRYPTSQHVSEIAVLAICQIHEFLDGPSVSEKKTGGLQGPLALSTFTSITFPSSVTFSM